MVTDRDKDPRSPKSQPEAFLLRLRAREPEALREFVRAWQSRLTAIAFRVTGDAAAAQDLCQETFLAAIDKLDTLESPERLGEWLQQIARRRSLDHARRRKPLSGESLPEPAVRDGDAPMEREEVFARLRSEVAKLDDEQADAVTRYYLEGLSAAAIARELGKSENAVNILLCRARQALYEKLKHFY